MPRWPAKDDDAASEKPEDPQPPAAVAAIDPPALQPDPQATEEVFDGAAAVTIPAPVKPDCPHCGGRLVLHLSLDGPKAGAEHCDSCGCCLIDGEPRPGTTRCTVGIAP